MPYLILLQISQPMLTNLLKKQLLTSQLFFKPFSIPISKHPSPILTFHPLYLISTDHKYKSQTTKQIQRQIAAQKWKQLQNTFKSLHTSFGLAKPTLQQLQTHTKYAKPDKIQYDLKNLRQCSHSYPIYLYHELEKNGSPFNLVIQKVLENLWKAEEKETLEFLEFLYAWDYQKIDVFQLHETVINKFDLNLAQLFLFLKRYDGKLYNCIQIKVLERLNMENLLSNQYGDLLKIVNYFTVKEVLSEEFFIAVTNCVEKNVNKIPPSQALQAYVFYTYNIQEHIDALTKAKQQKLLKKSNLQQKNSEQQKKNKKQQDLGVNIVKVIENRILSPECIKYYNGDQLVAVLHTFLKNNMILHDETQTQAYHKNLQKIVTRIQYGYYSSDFSTKNKENLLQLSPLLPQLKKQLIIALIQREYLKIPQKVDVNLLAPLYLISTQHKMMTAQLKQKLQHSIITSIFNLKKYDIARIVWLLTINNASNLNSMHKKIEAIIEGGMKEFQIEEVCIIVWSMCAVGYNQNGKFWDNIQAYLYQQLQRQFSKQSQPKPTNPQTPKQQQTQPTLTKYSQKQPHSLTTQISWILWAYLNNRQLSLQTISLIAQIIISEYSSTSTTKPKSTSNAGTKQVIKLPMSVFQLTNVISFFYSIQYPSTTIQQEIRKICMEQFNKIYITMQPIQLCKCLKYIGNQIWGTKLQHNRVVIQNILMIFQSQLETIAYRDIMSVVAVLLSSNIKNKRVTNIIAKLLQRKKKLQSLKQTGTQPTVDSNPGNMNKHKASSKKNV